MGIDNWVVINKKGLFRNGVLLVAGHLTPEQVYSELKCNYPKFYKMDKLCKWAFVATECLLGDSINTETDKNKIGVMLSTSHGCLDVDKRYADAAIPSPSLFVYTLPNIMLGEIGIRHGFKGEQVCTVNERFDASELYFATTVMLETKHMDACLTGWVDVSEEGADICMFWVSPAGDNFKPGLLAELYHK